MKIKITLIISIISLSWVMLSCEDVLDLNATKSLSDLAIWSTESAAEAYVTASYKTFTDVSQVFNCRAQYYDSYTDLMKSTDWQTYAPYNRALMEPNYFSRGSAGSFDCWGDVYVRIRRANVLLDEMNRYAVSRYGEDWCNIRRAEVRLCRAFAYFRLIRIYGGVIIRTENSGVGGGLDDGANKANINRARASEADSWQFVLDELKWAAENLPDSWLPRWEGRATKKTAYGFISRVALYAKKWDIAAEAAEKVKELGGGLAPDYAKIFKVQPDGSMDKDVAKEVLFVLYGLPKSVTHTYDRNNRPFGDAVVYSSNVNAEHVPTAELADLYEFKDGTPFDWNNWSLNHADPFTDREPRFQATMMYHGSRWESREIQTYSGGSDAFQEFSKASSPNGHTCTGYYLRKYLQEGHSSFITDQSFQYDAVLRYAEVLLNKAEAYAEQDFLQNREKALVALNEVRARVNLPGRTATDAPDKESFMRLLKRERCVELAGEGFRYWDLRRWRDAVAVIHGQNVHGVTVTKNTDNTYTYNRVECDGGSPRYFYDRYYYFSIPGSEVSNNNLCEDNDGW